MQERTEEEFLRMLLSAVHIPPIRLTQLALLLLIVALLVSFGYGHEHSAKMNLEARLEQARDS